MPDPQAAVPRLVRCQTGTVPIPVEMNGRALRRERWVVRTPRRLILADWREPNGWRLSFDGPLCRLYVPDYAPRSENYRLCVEDDRGEAYTLLFDVV